MKQISAIILYFVTVCRISNATFNCPSLFNWYPDIYDCSKFYRCIWGKGHSFTCPSGTLWSQKLLTCDHEKHVKCDSASQSAHGDVEAPDFSVDYEIHLATHHGEQVQKDASKESSYTTSHNQQAHQTGNLNEHGSSGHDYEPHVDSAGSKHYEEPQHEHPHSVYDYHGNHAGEDHYYDYHYDSHGYDVDYDHNQEQESHQSDTQHYNPMYFEHKVENIAEDKSLSHVQTVLPKNEPSFTKGNDYPQYENVVIYDHENGHGPQVISYPTNQGNTGGFPNHGNSAQGGHNQAIQVLVPPPNLKQPLTQPATTHLPPQQHGLQEPPQQSFVLKKPPSTIILKPSLVNEQVPVTSLDAQPSYSNFVLGKLLQIPRYGGHFYHEFNPVNTDGTYDVLELEPYKAKTPQRVEVPQSPDPWESTDLFRAGYGYRRIYHKK